MGAGRATGTGGVDNNYLCAAGGKAVKYGVASVPCSADVPFEE